MNRSVAFLALLLVAGCESRDPYERRDVWHPTGANAGNIAAMVANPRDLVAGRHTESDSSRPYADAVEHIWSNHPQPLGPVSGAAATSAASAAPPASGGTPAPGGAQ